MKPELSIESIPLEVLDAAKIVANFFALRGAERWELLDICSRNHAVPPEQAYVSMIDEATERVCRKRIEEIEGRPVELAEIAEHGERRTTEATGIMLFLWKGKPICECVAGRYTEYGWKNASVKELRPALIHAV